MEVRDYECDIEGIVNNANYLHYTEHTRHLFLKECGLSFAEMHEKGVDAVVARMNLQFKTPLRCDDEFISRLWLEKEGIKYRHPLNFKPMSYSAFASSAGAASSAAAFLALLRRVLFFASLGAEAARAASLKSTSSMSAVSAASPWRKPR